MKLLNPGSEYSGDTANSVPHPQAAEDRIQMTVGGQVFDIHNAFALQGYTYDTAQHVFELKPLGHNYYLRKSGYTH